VLIPQPAQGHVTPMLHLAKALHARGFRVTYVNSEYNHRRLLRSRGQDSLAGTNGFHFEAVPDGLPQSDNDDVTQDIAALCLSTTEHSAAPFRDLLARLNATPGSPPVSCVIADGVMSFAQLVAEEMGILAHQCVRLHGVPPLYRAYQTRLPAAERYRVLASVLLVSGTTTVMILCSGRNRFSAAGKAVRRGSKATGNHGFTAAGQLARHG